MTRQSPPDASLDERTEERRRLLKLLVAAGLLAPAAADALQSRGRITNDVLERAAALLDSELTDERLRELVPSIQRNLDFFQIVRDLEIDDQVEPPVLFRARGE